MGVAVRKAARQTLVDDAPKTRSVPNKRNTKLWCKGKVGVEHKPVVGTWRAAKNWSGPNIFHGGLIQYCSECGKEIAQFLPMRGSARPTPEWAEAFYVLHPEERPETR
jgi:hypothetical protein